MGPTSTILSLFLLSPFPLSVLFPLSPSHILPLKLSFHSIHFTSSASKLHSTGAVFDANLS